jgi:predicted DNA-binding transcriptional regulator AlpA
MMYRIPLRVAGVTLEDDAMLARIADKPDDLTWTQIDGRVLAIVHTNRRDLVELVVSVARRIGHVVPGAVVEEVDPELVNIPDVAARLGVSREAVRLWADGHRGPGDFPPPIGSVGGGARGSIRVWRWADIQAWFRRHYSLGGDDLSLSAARLTEVNSALADVRYQRRMVAIRSA